MRFLIRLCFLSLLVIGLLVGWLYWFATSSINPIENEQLVSVQPGSVRSVAQQLVNQQIISNAFSFELLVRGLGNVKQIKAGVYKVSNGITVYDLIAKLTNGDISQTSITFIEGWTFSQMREVLNQHQSIRHLTMSYTDHDIMSAIGATEDSPEGLFFPDTYFFSQNISDLDILKQSYATMQKKLAMAWGNRDMQTPYKTPYEALIMASIVEKETGKSSERPQIAGVFVNRLKIGMRLQTDPAVIYGLGDKFDGNLRKKDLLADTPYNTYTRAGLTPTPIAMPGLASIEAAMHPAKTKAIYFVGKGDGSHAFSDNLDEHNRAVVRYQLHRN